MNNNSYSNAASGIRKVFTSEILDIINVIPIFIAVVLTAAAAAAGVLSLSGNTEADGIFTGVLIGALVAFIIFIVLAIISFILKLVGLSKAGKDHVYFKYAFGLVFIGILLVIGSSIFTAYPVVSSLMSTGKEVVDVIIMIFTVYGCMQLLAEKGNESMVYSGFTVVNVMIFVNILSVIARLIPSFMVVGSIIGTIFMGFYAALTIVSGLMYLVFLNKSAKALA